MLKAEWEYMQRMQKIPVRVQMPNGEISEVMLPQLEKDEYGKISVVGKTHIINEDHP